MLLSIHWKGREGYKGKAFFLSRCEAVKLVSVRFCCDCSNSDQVQDMRI